VYCLNACPDRIKEGPRKKEEENVAQPPRRWDQEWPRRSDLDYANGAYVDYSYDTAGRVLYGDNRTNNGQHKYAYTYDYVGNRMDMTVTDSGGVRSTVYSYDATYQVTGVDYPASMSYLATDTTFNYDAAGNRTSVIDGSGTTPYTTNNLNQCTSADGAYYKHDTSGKGLPNA
jgi:YD repeat-containing protein